MPQAPEVRGVGLDGQTRCVHYHSPLDIVAIRMRCCGVYYACVECHIALAGHAIEVWPITERHRSAVRCGRCGLEMTTAEYLASDDRCPACGAGFNPQCRDHHHYYFAAN